jgi:RNA polymerase sporulation-specific sigma factor
MILEVILLFQMVVYTLLNCYYLILYITGQNAFLKPLSADEEQMYFKLLKEGDKQARSKLIEHNLRLVAYIVKKYYSRFKENEDLISIGTIGLIKAVDTFDYEKGAKFATYASRCIENEVLMYFRNTKKLCAEVSLSESIDSDSDGNNLSIIDILKTDDNITDIVDLKIKVAQLLEYIDKQLTPRERKIIKVRYGLLGTRPLTQREVASQLLISRSYVSRIEKKALSKLKKYMSVNYGKDFF